MSYIPGINDDDAELNEFDDADPSLASDDLEGDAAPSTHLSLMGGVSSGGFSQAADPVVAEAEGGTWSDKLSHSGVVMGAIALVAVGSLFAMRWTQGDLSTSTVSRSVDAKIEDLLIKVNSAHLPADSPLRAENMEALFQDTDEIVAEFGRDHTERQVPIDYVKKDPFLLWEPPVVATVEEAPVVEEKKVDPEALRLARLKELRGELKQLELQSVMDGRRPIAVIGGEFRRLDDQIGSFVLERIEPLRVHLRAEGELFQLDLDRPENGPGVR